MKQIYLNHILNYMGILEITTKIGCKNFCSYCPQEKIINAYKKISNEITMTLDTFKKCIDNTTSNTGIHFTGMCEPFLNNECSDMMLYANSKNHNITVSTTLVGLQKNDIEKIKDINFKQFAIHLPAKSGTSDNIKITDEYIYIIKNIKMKNMGFHFHGNEIPNELKFLPANKARIISRAGNLDEYKKANLKKPAGCSRKFNQPVLLPNGDVTLCCMDYGLEYIYGNLLKTTLSDMQAGGNFKRIKTLAQYNFCYKCDAYGINGG